MKPGHLSEQQEQRFGHCETCKTKTFLYEKPEKRFFCCVECQLDSKLPKWEGSVAPLITEKGPVIVSSNLTRDLSHSTKPLDILYTDENMQLGIENVVPGGSLPVEIHPTQTQMIMIQEGEASIRIYGDGKEEEGGRRLLSATSLSAGDYAIIHASTYHEVLNTGSGTMRFYTIYAPRVH